VPHLRFVDGRLVAEPDSVAKLWLPLHGQVFAKFPPHKDNCQWLHTSVAIHSPRQDKDKEYWHLPRSCLTRLVTAAVDRYGYVAVLRDISSLSRCTKACLQATGTECNCSCYGAHHGQDSDAWYQRIGDAVVADLGETTRSLVLYGPRGAEGDGGALYNGELSGRLYHADRAGRHGWPPASRFMCAGCLSARAQVWDHCHVHNFVRAPLCNSCNTRHWSGWHPEQGRATPSSNLDTSYYRWCPRYSDRIRQQCSA
jgi:recombination endonuclease VII